MRRYKWYPDMLIGLALLSGFVVACSKPEPANFELTSFEITPPEVIIGETVSASVGVKNSGGTEGTYTVTLTIDGVKTDTKVVKLAPGASETVTFPLFKDKAGAYQVAIDSFISTLTVKEKIAKKIVIDGVLDEWPSHAITIPDSCGDVSDQAKSKKGADLKTVWALMEDDYLYMAIQLCDAFAPSLLRNYFIGLDLDKDGLPDYDFGVRPYDFSGRPAGQAWVLVYGLTGNKSDWFSENNWERREAYPVVALGKLDTGILEIAIPREVYQISDTVLALVRVTEGGPNVDSTKSFEIHTEKGK